MGRNLPATSPAAPRVIYVDPVPNRGAVAHTSPAAVEARRRAEHLAYLRWKQRQAEIAEHDRRFRRFWLGFGAVTGAGVLAVLGLVVWLLAHTLGAGLLAIPLILLALAGVAAGGRRCVTVVEHWH